MLESGFLDSESPLEGVPSSSSAVLGKHKMQNMSLLSLSGLDFDSLPIVKATEAAVEDTTSMMDPTPVESMSEDMPRLPSAFFGLMSAVSSQNRTQAAATLA